MVTTRRSAAREAALGSANGEPETPVSTRRKSLQADATPAPTPGPNGHIASSSSKRRKSTSSTYQTPKTTHYEFFGPHGPLFLVLALPVVVYGLVYGCNASACLQVWPQLSIPGFPSGSQLFKWEALGVYCAWVGGLALLHLILPGKRVTGVLLPDGSRLTYKLNGLTLWVLTYSSSLYLAFFTPYLNLGWLYTNFLPLLTASVLFSSALALYLYLSSFKKGALLSAHGNSGWWWYDFWMGRELNPRLGPLDLKEWCELTPGMIGWSLINLGMAHAQWTRLGRVTNSMIMVNVFQGWYIVDALLSESSILTTMDITTDGFGFMLSFGDLTWVPFVFTTSARFLVDYPQEFGVLGVCLVVGMQVLGYTMFRAANGQKDLFRRDPTHPKVRHLKTLPTARGTKLIISGWWGTSRHINYFADWLMGLSWCMTCGLPGLMSVIPYFYSIYFATLLIHRERRDHAACSIKYGKDWDTYCALVKYRIIPYVY